MALLRSRQLYKGNLQSTNWTTIYTVPSGHVIVIRDLSMFNMATGASTCWVRVGGVQLLQKSLAAKGQSGADFQWMPWLVVDEGQAVEVAIGSPANCNLILSGTYLFY